MRELIQEVDTMTEDPQTSEFAKAAGGMRERGGTWGQGGQHQQRLAQPPSAERVQPQCRPTCGCAREHVNSEWAQASQRGGSVGGDAHSATDFHFLFLSPPALTNFTDDQRPLAEEQRCMAVCARHVAPGRGAEVDAVTGPRGL